MEQSAPNLDRAWNIAEILKTNYGAATVTNLIDLLSCARHFADRENIDFNKALDDSYRKYSHEVITGR